MHLKHEKFVLARGISTTRPEKREEWTGEKNGNEHEPFLDSPFFLPNFTYSDIGGCMPPKSQKTANKEEEKN